MVIRTFIVSFIFRSPKRPFVKFNINRKTRMFHCVYCVLNQQLREHRILTLLYIVAAFINLKHMFNSTDLIFNGWNNGIFVLPSSN